ncbi:hypothetical protein [Curtobacterium sp. MCBD17_040]|uniref:hypothetical protein n=1 Tax=Curtobacterium sp. MCBD17_040 TaxID=2175674 RepID=UPI000DA6E822|nr:hypothetical protein [Curtobacterium sp. MCBD17_040]WIB65809.1 hypothetical protein DEI94_16985 [Curtobacterium sp. MCBD17_040]
MTDTTLPDLQTLLTDADEYAEPTQYSRKDTPNYVLVRNLTAALRALTADTAADRAIIVPVALIDDVMGSAGSVNNPDDPIEQLYTLAHPENTVG